MFFVLHKVQHKNIKSLNFDFSIKPETSYSTPKFLRQNSSFEISETQSEIQKADNDQITIQIVTNRDEPIEKMVPIKTSVTSLKNQLAEQCFAGSEIDQISLRYQGDELSDGKTLESYDIKVTIIYTCDPSL